MQITIDLNDEQSVRMQELARKHAVDPKELVRAACTDLLNRPDEEFRKSLDYLLQKNRELYERLS